MQDHSTKVMRLFADIFGWLPLATLVNNKILVTHGGISNITDLAIIDKIDRHKVSIKYVGRVESNDPTLLTTLWTTLLITLGKSIYTYA